jgi:Flp pilus assembly protein TadG
LFLLRLIRKKRPSAERGQSLAEFSLVLPILLLLIIGIVEVGNGLNSYLTVVDAARDGARLGAKGSASEAQIKDLIVKEAERLPNGVDPTAIAVDITSSEVTVQVCYDHPLIVGLPPIIPDPLTLCSTTSMPSSGGP